MARKREKSEPMSAMLHEHIDHEISKMPLNCLQDYMAYNKKAREINKKMRRVIFPIKPCPVELHPKQRIVFNRIDQPKNPLNGFYLCNDMIEFRMDLVPGQVYDLPECVIDHLAKKGTPVWEWYDLPADKAGQTKRETRISHYEPRFALRMAV